MTDPVSLEESESPGRKTGIRRKKEQRTLIPYAEVLASGPLERRFKESPIAIIQTLTFFYYFITMIIFLVEAQGVHFINTYIYTIIYGSVGGALNIIVGTIGWYKMQVYNFFRAMYMRGNRLPSGSSIPSAEGRIYMGWPHVMALTIAWLMGCGAFVLITWFLAEWVTRFHKTADASNPDVTMEPEYILFIAAMQVGFLLSFITLAFFLHAIFAHMKPLRTITRLLIESTPEKKQ